MLHTPCTHCWFDCFGIPANVVAVFTAAHMKPRAPCKATLPTSCPCCTLYEQHTPCCTQTHTHKHMPACMLMCYCSRFRATPDESALRPCAPSFHVNFTHMLQQPWSVVSALCPCAFTFMYISHNTAAAAIAEGSCLLRVWSLQCDHRVLTATHEFWCNPKATLLQGSRHSSTCISHA
jgi:hypothetical protein